MNKIEFKNLPSTETPLSAENLNLMQDNIEDAIDNVSIDLDTEASTTSTNGIENQAITNYVDEKTTYSTDEKVVGKWIDGKPLYRKTIVFPNGTGQTSVKTYNLSDYGISNVSEIFIVHPSFYTYDARRYPFQYNDGSAFESNITPTQLNITLGYAPIANSRFVITIEYTKTTD